MSIGVSGTLTYGEGYILPNCGANITSLQVNTTTDNAGGGNPGGFITVVIMEWSGLSTTPYTATERMAAPPAGSISTQDTGGTINNGTAVSVFFAGFFSENANVITTINASGSDGTWIEPPNTRGTGIATEMCAVYQIVNTSAARKEVVSRVNNVNGTFAIEFVLHQ